VSERPIVAVVAGPNGAGKSTLAPALLRDMLGLTDYVNADVVALGLSGFDPDAAGLAAGRIVLARLRALGASGRSFAFETTLATRSFAPWLRELGASGYEVVVLLLWLPSPELAASRVAQRVALGGHDVPLPTIRRRYTRGLGNFFRLYRPLAHRWVLWDSSEARPRRIAAGSRRRVEHVDDPRLWRRLVETHDETD